MKLPLRRGHMAPALASATMIEHIRPDPPGAVRFETAWARRRFIRIEHLGDIVHFVAPRARNWPGQDRLAAATPQAVTRRALPDTVTCGQGYIEVLAFVDGGIVVNEVRTQGDEVIAMAGWGLWSD